MTLTRRLTMLRDAVRDRPSRALTWVIGVLAAGPRLWSMLADQGVFWPDEIFQTIEQGHRLAFGYGIVPWEFRDGARSWLFPGFLGVLMKVGSWIGLVRSGVGVVLLVKATMVACALVALVASLRIAERLGGTHGALVAGALIALFPPSIVYGARAMTETASAPLLAVATWLVLDDAALEPAPSERARPRSRLRLRPRSRMIAAGALAALSIYTRYQNGLLAVTLLLALAFGRRWRDAAWYGAAAFVIGIAGGMLDWATWGRPFHSFIVYVKFNLIDQKGNQWGVSPFDYYATAAWHSASWPMLIVALGIVVAAVALSRARVVALGLVVYFVAHSFVPHKELRFMMPVVPLAFAVAGGGVGWLLDRVPRAGLRGWLATGLAVAIGVQLALSTRTITFGDMGQYLTGPMAGPNAELRPWHHDEGPNLAFWDAGKEDDLCGMILLDTPLWAVGGYSYLHKNVPIMIGATPLEIAAANYVAMKRLTPPPEGYRVIAGYPDYVLAKRAGGCAPAPPWVTDQL